jgi:hypothetical protein
LQPRKYRIAVTNKRSFELLMQMLIFRSNACNYKNKEKWRSEGERHRVYQVHGQQAPEKRVTSKKELATNLPTETFAEPVPANHATAAVGSAKSM